MYVLIAEICVERWFRGAASGLFEVDLVLFHSCIFHRLVEKGTFRRQLVVKYLAISPTWIYPHLVRPKLWHFLYASSTIALS